MPVYTYVYTRHGTVMSKARPETADNEARALLELFAIEAERVPCDRGRMADNTQRFKVTISVEHDR